MDWLPTCLCALTRPATELHGWHLMVFCRGCRVLVRLEVERLARRHAGARIVDVVDRLRCSRCGAPPASVMLADGVQGQGVRTVHQVELLDG